MQAAASIGCDPSRVLALLFPSCCRTGRMWTVPRCQVVLGYRGPHAACQTATWVGIGYTVDTVCLDGLGPGWMRVWMPSSHLRDLESPPDVQALKARCNGTLGLGGREMRG